MLQNNLILNESVNSCGNWSIEDANKEEIESGRNGPIIHFSFPNIREGKWIPGVLIYNGDLHLRKQRTSIYEIVYDTAPWCARTKVFIPGSIRSFKWHFASPTVEEIHIDDTDERYILSGYYWSELNHSLIRRIYEVPWGGFSEVVTAEYLEKETKSQHVCCLSRFLYGRLLNTSIKGYGVICNKEQGTKWKGWICLEKLSSDYDSKTCDKNLYSTRPYQTPFPTKCVATRSYTSNLKSLGRLGSYKIESCEILNAAKCGLKFYQEKKNGQGTRNSKRASVQK